MTSGLVGEHLARPDAGLEEGQPREEVSGGGLGRDPAHARPVQVPLAKGSDVPIAREARKAQRSLPTRSMVARRANTVANTAGLV